MPPLEPAGAPTYRDRMDKPQDALDEARRTAPLHRDLRQPEQDAEGKHGPAEEQQCLDGEVEDRHRRHDAPAQ